MNQKDLKEFLDSKVIQYNNVKFIESDPIQIPHLFQKKEDIEIIGFLVANLVTEYRLLLYIIWWQLIKPIDITKDTKF